MRYSLHFLVLAIFSVAVLRAQINPGAGSSYPGGGAGVPGGIGPGSSIPNGAGQSGIPGDFPNPDQTPIFLSGRVLMEDGARPPAGIPIVRECSGATRTVAYTNEKGQFSFQWGDSAGIMPDASQGGFGGRGVPDIGAPRERIGDPAMTKSMFGCDLIASAAGFHSDRIDLSGRRPADSSDVGSIMLHRIAGVEGTSVSATALNAPKDARKAWEKGVQLLHKSKPEEAEKELQKAVRIDPQYANAWLDLGRAKAMENQEGPAREAFLKAVAVDDKLVDPYVQLGEMAAHEKTWPDAARYLDRALDLDPVDYPRLWFEDAVADYNMQNFDRAEKNARAASRLQPPDLDPHSEQLLGLILENKRDYAGASEALRAYLRLSPGAPDEAQVKAQLGQLESHIGAAKPQ